MKAGVYKTPNGNLIYVAKDRTIKATTLSPSSWPGTKVSHRAKDNTVVIADTGYRCEHYADVPNGCTDHQALVDSMHMAASLQPGERVVDYGTKLARVEPATDDEFDRIKAAADDPYKRMAESTRQVTKAMRHVGAAAEGAAEATRRFFTVPPELSMPYTDGELVEWRKKFASMLRQQGFRICHKVSARKHRKRGHTVVPLHDNWFAWRPVDYLHPYQRDLVNRFKGLTLKVPAGVGKTETMAVPRTLVYVGPLEHLKGKKALTMPARSSGVLLAQFDDITATRSGEPLPEVETPEPPVDALGFHWHEFPNADFAGAP